MWKGWGGGEFVRGKGGGRRKAGREEGEGGGIYRKLEGSVFIPLGCKQPKWTMRCCFTSLCMAFVW